MFSGVVCSNRYYCMDDKVYMCKNCILGERHSGHLIETMKNTMEDLKAHRSHFS